MNWRLLISLALLASVLAAADTRADGAKLVLGELFHRPPDFAPAADGGVLARDPSGWVRLVVTGGRIAAIDTEEVPYQERNVPGIIPGAMVARSNGDIAAAWLAAPTDRYRHGVLGDEIEAGELRVLMRDGRTLRHAVPRDSVFEDLEPRIADIDGDGQPEVVVVRSYLNAGAAVAVFAVRGEAVTQVAQARPIGSPYRWLNPVGIADFDGDGKTEIAIIETPHIDGRLKLLERQGNALIADEIGDGFSNHVIGSAALSMHAVFDWNADGVPDMAIPSQNRRSLRVVTARGGKLVELARIDHPHAIVAPMILGDLNGNGVDDVVYALFDGTVCVLIR